MKVTTHHKAYSLFDLIVDIGSSLGLWIGLSALGVFDLLIEAGDIINAFRSGMTKKDIKWWKNWFNGDDINRKKLIEFKCYIM